MCKKTYFLILCCIFYLTSFTFANEIEHNLSFFLGDTFNLKSYLQQENIELTSNTTIQNANKEVIRIDQNYNLKTLSIGQTLLVITNGHDFITLHVNVKSPIESIELQNQEITLYLGEIYTISYTVTPKKEYTKPISQLLKWSSSKNNIVGVKNSNKIYTMTTGTTTLTGTTSDGSASISIKVNVIGNPNRLIIKPDSTDNFVQVGETRQLQAFFDTKNVSKSIKWSSAYPDLLKVDSNGLVTPLKAGTCNVTAESSITSKKDTFTFFITSMVKNISLDQSSIIFEEVGLQSKLNAHLNYAVPNIRAIRDGYYYKSSNENVATVDNNGLVTAKGYGIALITVYSNDSAKKDSCTVEVLNSNKPTTINYIPVEELTLSSETSIGLIGQKIPLTYNLLPKDATNTSVRFHLQSGELKQIKLIDNQYYFVPEKRGNYKIKISSENNIEDTIEIKVISPITSLKLHLNTDNSKKEETLYIGEQVELFTDIFTYGHYNDFDVYPTTLNYTVDDPDIIKLEFINNKYYITGLQGGTTSVRVKNIENHYKDSLKIKILSPIKSISTEKEITLPLNYFYTPSINYKPTSKSRNMKNLNIIHGIGFEVESFYFKEKYIDEEISYEKQIINYFSNLPYSIATNSSISQHKKRLDHLNVMKRNASEGYCLVSDNYLKNRNFKPYKFYSIKNNQISGHYPGKAKVSIMLNGSSVKAQSIFYWNDDFNTSSLTSSAQYNYYLPQLSQNDNKHLLVKKIIELNNANFPSSFTKDLSALTTKQELAYVAMYLNDHKQIHKWVNTDNLVFYDIIDPVVMQAIALKYITTDSNNYFNPSDKISYKDFKDIIDYIYPQNQLNNPNDMPISHLQIIEYLSELD